MNNTLNDIMDIEEHENAKRVGRLSDMDTREVSLVDRAANKRRFLLVKRQQEEEVGATTKVNDETTVQEAEPKTEVKVEVKSEVGKAVTVAVIQDARERVDYLRAAIEAADVAKNDSEVPPAYSSEVRAIQFMLKGLAGITCKNSGLMIPVNTNLDEAGPLTKSYKDESWQVLQEVGRRLESLKQDLDGVTILDAAQARRINDTADLLARVPQAKGESVILLSSLNADQRGQVLKAVESTMGGLMDVFVALQTDGIEKGSDVADQFEVGSVIHGHAALLEKAVAGILEDAAGEVDLIDAAVEQMRVVQDVEKQFMVKPMDGSFAVVDGQGKVHGKFPNLGMAAGVAARMNANTANAKMDKMEALMKVMLNPTKDVSGDVAPVITQTETEKVGRPMRGDRLNRLKSAVSLLKDALGDLRSGSISMEKFNKVGSVLSGLISEMQVHKRGAAAALSGVADVRTTDPSAPNMGSGVQPDTSMIGTMDDVMGEGTGGTANLLKQVESMLDERVKGVMADKDAEIGKLRGELSKLRKSRSAPSAPPSDGESIEDVTKGDDSDKDNCYWPRDLAAWDGKETHD